MIPESVKRAAEARRNEESGRLAAALLASARPSRADVMCARERHVLARVYLLPDGRRVLARDEFKMLRGELEEGIPSSDTTEVVFPVALFDLDKDELQIYFRCRCHTYTEAVPALAAQLDRLPWDDRWLMVGISSPPGKYAQRRSADGTA